MSASIEPSGKLTIAWAAQVSLPQLCARLTAYVQTKATITALRFSARHSLSAAFRRLPEEILAIIASCLRDVVYQSEIEQWIKIDRCLANTCDPLSHFSHEEMTKRYRCCTNWMTGDEMDYDEFLQEIIVRHDDVLETWYGALAGTYGTATIAKFAKVFEQDFGIRPYFVLDKQYEDLYEVPNYVVDAKAYLSIPLTHMPISSTAGPEVATFAVNTILDFSILTELTEDQQRNFTAAATVLDLHAYNSDEDASMFKRRPGSCGCTTWEDCRDPDNWEELDGDRQAIYSRLGCPTHMSISRFKKGDKNSGACLIYHGGAEYHPRYRDEPEKKFERQKIQPRLMILGSGELESRPEDY
ncbi:MAG: hypothetical protein Q9169_006445 [Polycauliona sp. 2 TL-2023]